MNMTQEMLEILIGKFLDGEITPSEQQILQTELDGNPQAKELLQQLQDLHERSCEAVTSEVVASGKEADEIFEQAWQRRQKYALRPMIKVGGYMRFAAGVAAGLTIGLMLHFVLPFVSTPQSPDVPANVVAKNPGNQMGVEQLTFPEPLTDPAGNSLRNVDWYSFTDSQGNQWLIEGLRENTVRPAVYYGDL